MMENNNTQASPFWKQRWFKVISPIVVMLALSLSALPMLVSNNLKSWLLENGADDVAIENIDINPFTGTAAVYGLDIKLDNRTVASNTLVSFDLSLMSLLKKGIAFENVILKDVSIDIEQYQNGKIRIGSLVLDPSKKTDKEIKKEIKEEVAWWLGLGKVMFDNCSVNFTSPQMSSTLILESASLQNLSTQPGNQKAEIDIDARFNNSDISANITLEELLPAVQLNGNITSSRLSLSDFSGYNNDVLNSLSSMVDLSGNFSVTVTEEKEVNASFTGKTKFSGTDIASKEVSVKAESLSWDGTLALQIEEEASRQKIDVDGSLALTGYLVDLPGIQAEAANTNWQGKLSYASKAAKEPGNINLDGTLTGKEIRLGLSRQNLIISQQEVNASPALSIQIGSGATDLSGEASIEAAGTSVIDTAKSLTLLTINKLKADGIKMESLNKASINRINVGEAALIRGKESKNPSIMIGDTYVDIVEFDAVKGLAIKSIAVARLDGTFTRGKDGSIDIAKALQPATPAKGGTLQTKEGHVTATAEKTDQQIEREDPFPVKIAELSIRQNSLVKFSDFSVSPAFNTEVDIASLKLTDIDSSQPDKAIPVELNSTIDKYASLTVTGSVKPFLDHPATDLVLDLDDLNMVGLSPYVTEATGYLIKAGQLSIDSEIQIKDNTIDSQNTLFMKKLHLEQADQAIATENAGHIGMPLEKALGMLRDRHDNIELEVPITGKLDEIDIGTGKIINIALKKATTVGMKTYLLYAFQPYGAMIIATQTVGKTLGKIKLDPLFFDAGKSTLTDSNRDYLKKLGKVMQDRPQINVQICGYATAADAGISIKKDENAPAQIPEAEMQGLLSLAEDRQKTVKDHMISEFNIKDGRLILCAPGVNRKGDSKPRVELII